MTVSTKVIGYYHQVTCPSKENSGESCTSKSIQLRYQCSNYDCKSSKLKEKVSYVQGCSAARAAAEKTSSCTSCSNALGRKT